MMMTVTAERTIRATLCVRTTGAVSIDGRGVPAG
jgi:hypothetical protein